MRNTPNALNTGEKGKEGGMKGVKVEGGREKGRDRKKGERKGGR